MGNGPSIPLANNDSAILEQTLGCPVGIYARYIPGNRTHDSPEVGE